jgi:hypothetical protein
MRPSFLKKSHRPGSKDGTMLSAAHIPPIATKRSLQRAITVLQSAIENLELVLSEQSESNGSKSLLPRVAPPAQRVIRIFGGENKISRGSRGLRTLPL